MDQDVVLVVPQYRLNVLGFLTLEDREAPGNYGMLDQQEALRLTLKRVLINEIFLIDIFQMGPRQY